jgi:hypothetical protein
VGEALLDAKLSLIEQPVGFGLELHPYVKPAQQAAWIASVAGLFWFAAVLLFGAARRQSSRRARLEPGVAP